MANLAATYARLLAACGGGYETLPTDARLASARKLLKAVVESCELETSAPLCRLFEQRPTDTWSAVEPGAPPSRWASNITAPNPPLEVECLGQTLTPVVTNLAAGKFLWQALSEVRSTVFQAIENMPPPIATFPEMEAEKSSLSPPTSPGANRRRCRGPKMKPFINP